MIVPIFTNLMTSAGISIIDRMIDSAFQTKRIHDDFKDDPKDMLRQEMVYRWGFYDPIMIDLIMEYKDNPVVFTGKNQKEVNKLAEYYAKDEKSFPSLIRKRAADIGLIELPQEYRIQQGWIASFSHEEP